MAFGCIKVHQPVVQPSLQGVKIFYVQVKCHCIVLNCFIKYIAMQLFTGLMPDQNRLLFKYEFILLLYFS